MKYARIINSIAVDTRTETPVGFFTPNIAAEFTEVPDTVEDGWSNATGEWLAPPPVVIPEPYPFILPEPIPEPRRITRLAFRNRFTLQEKVALEIAQLDNPAASMQDRAQAAALRASQADLASATFVDLNNPDTRGGVEMLEAAGLLAVGRATEILDTPFTDSERPS